jgi:hypothetical protein
VVPLPLPLLLLLLLPQTFDRFKFNCIFDLSLFFCRGADRMRVLSNLLAVPFDKVTAEPKLVSVQMLNNRCASQALRRYTCSSTQVLCDSQLLYIAKDSSWLLFCAMHHTRVTIKCVPLL